MLSSAALLSVLLAATAPGQHHLRLWVHVDDDKVVIRRAQTVPGPLPPVRHQRSTDAWRIRLQNEEGKVLTECPRRGAHAEELRCVVYPPDPSVVRAEFHPADGTSGPVHGAARVLRPGPRLFTVRAPLLSEGRIEVSRPAPEGWVRVGVASWFVKPEAP